MANGQWVMARMGSVQKLGAARSDAGNGIPVAYPTLP